MTSSSTRRYDSTLRLEMAEQTRAAILAAGSRLFIERGWAGTSMRDVAKRAGCSVETVYSSVGNKRDLLKVALDVAVVGDDDPRPLVERPEFQAMSEGSLADRAAAVGRLLTWIHRRTAPLNRVLDHAAAADPQLVELAEKTRADERVSVRTGVIAVAQRAVTEAEVDAMQAVMSNDVYLLLTVGSGWSDEQYQNWVADTVVRLLDLREE
ncbi:TetR/AcrR family transcriptional regulator [Antrihabitans sp. YC2-6]|uniref:TetR/AcrR family transcriptional regulator n=1 Tax=Antrihabitans sp. YC2-6 TaxID=2799498 RepID=UPI0018F5C732|nr:TetR/AcrR family transcriptional regulator [Antrihabitans sp. YC2-6]MBJ8343695.1 TetR/AcrR family transcriptional regulator [Antrihabitans sp. YC2-6]